MKAEAHHAAFPNGAFPRDIPLLSGGKHCGAITPPCPPQ